MMEETPVIQETPVSREIPIQENVFFYWRENRTYLQGNDAYQRVRVSIPPSTNTNQILVVAFLGIVAILIFLLGSSWIVGVLAGSVAATMLIGSAVTYKQQTDLSKRLTREGEFLPGTLLSCTAIAEGWGHHQSFDVESVYEFKSPQGSSLQGREKQTRPDLSGTQLPAPGSPVYILYFSDTEFYLL